MSLINGHIDRLRSFEFWREGCHTFAKNVTTMLERALKDWDMAQALQFLQTLPRNRCELASDEWQKSYCCLCLQKAWENSPQGAREALDYFTNYFVDRNYDAQAMLINSIVGIVGGIEAAEKELENKEMRGEPLTG
ncbi:MAG TPA: hypothetical protein VH592_08410 [Gemmataceae bacterium]|jgi:hypothetical protein